MRKPSVKASTVHEPSVKARGIITRNDCRSVAACSSGEKSYKAADVAICSHSI